jgi:hypothetical protein
MPYLTGRAFFVFYIYTKIWMIRGYIQHTDHVVLVMQDASQVSVYPNMLAGKEAAYTRLLFLLHRMHNNTAAAEIINRFVNSLKN